jgi:LuxR family transcriptional regulator
MDLRAYLGFLSEVDTLEELWASHVKQMGSYGFTRLLYGYTHFRTETSFGDPDDFMVLSNHDPEYLHGFLDEGRYFNAPMTQWALSNNGAASWTLLAERFNRGQFTPEELKIMEFNIKMGVTTGYTISFKSNSARFKAAIGLVGEPGMSQQNVDAVWEEHGEDIYLMNNFAHLKIITMPYSSPNRELTPRQREALEWAGDGKTTQDIALLMGLTTATVEKHLRLARETLSVDTTTQAVLKASLQNQMFALNA